MLTKKLQGTNTSFLAHLKDKWATITLYLKNLVSKASYGITISSTVCVVAHYSSKWAP
jgi:hypothetical protein